MKNWDVAGVAMWICIAVIVVSAVRSCDVQYGYRACLTVKQTQPSVECKQP